MLLRTTVPFVIQLNPSLHFRQPHQIVRWSLEIVLSGLTNLRTYNSTASQVSISTIVNIHKQIRFDESAKIIKFLRSLHLSPFMTEKVGSFPRSPRVTWLLPWNESNSLFEINEPPLAVLQENIPRAVAFSLGRRWGWLGGLGHPPPQLGKKLQAFQITPRTLHV